jgi:hypothetical protein
MGSALFLRYVPFWRQFVHPQLEEVSSCGDGPTYHRTYLSQDPLITWEGFHFVESVCE